MSFVRSSKFRHVFGTPFKRDKCYDGVRITKSPHDSSMCAVNGKFLAVVLESQGGGAFLVAPLEKVGRFDINYPKVSGHRSLVLDVAWNPFNENQIASCSEDCTVKLWDIPDGGLQENLTASALDLSGHQKKVSQILWHPCAENVLASVGYDHVIIIWNTGSGKSLSTIRLHPDIIFCMSWNYNGSLIATTCKDKKIRVVDPRKGEVVTEGNGHAGNKPSRIVFCGTTNKLFTTGFSRSSERQYGLWDAGNLDKALNMTKIDDGIGVMFPYWDEGTHMVYVVGKGDQKFVYFEITKESPYVHFLNMYQPTQPVRGAACLPKKHVNYMHCEVMRFYNLITKGLIEPVSMTVPRKSDMFQDDIFPPFASDEPALSAEEWASGQDKDPKLLAFTTDGIEQSSEGPKSTALKVTAAPKKAEPAPKSISVSVSSKPPSVQRQSSGTTSSGRSSRDATPPFNEPKTLEEYRKAYRELVKENFNLYRKAYKELEEENRRLRERLGK